MVMSRILCCFISCTKRKPSSPPQVVQTGKKIPPSPLPPQGVEMANRQPAPLGVVRMKKGIAVKDGGLVVAKSSKTTTKSSRRRKCSGNETSGVGSCGGGCGGGGGG